MDVSISLGSGIDAGYLHLLDRDTSTTRQISYAIKDSFGREEGGKNLNTIFFLSRSRSRANEDKCRIATNECQKKKKKEEEKEKRRGINAEKERATSTASSEAGAPNTVKPHRSEASSRPSHSLRILLWAQTRN